MAYTDMEQRILDMWPKYEDGSYVWFGDAYRDVRRKDTEVDAIMFNCMSIFIEDIEGSSMELNPNERVKRPAPKVLDADGVEISAGDEVYIASYGDGPWTVTKITTAHAWHVYGHSDELGSLDMQPNLLTHRAPVLAADGEPLEAGQTVYVIATGKTHHVTEVDAVYKRFRSMEQVDGSHWLDPMCFTHQRPVLDADGVPIKVGDTVYFTDGREQKCNTVVNAKYDYKDEAYVQLGLLNEAGHPMYTNCSCIAPSQLTHTRPDSWERLERDAEKSICDYFGSSSSPDSLCEDGCPGLNSPVNCGVLVKLDLIRRAKALAEKEAAR